MMGDEITVRMARNDETETVKRIVESQCNIVGMEWVDIAPYWLVAETDRVIGVIQVCPGRPIGRLEFLCFDSGTPDKIRVKAMRQLYLQGCATLKVGGAQFASGLIGFERKALKRWLKRNGAVVMDTGNILVKRL